MVQWYLSKKGESPMYRSRQEAPEEGVGEKRYNVTEREHVVPERGLAIMPEGLEKATEPEGEDHIIIHLQQPPLASASMCI